MSGKTLLSNCQACGHPYTYDSDAHNFSRKTCENCTTKIYVRTGKPVKHIEIFHTATPIKKEIRDWELEDFGKFLLGRNNLPTNKIIPFFETLLLLPEWQDIAKLCRIEKEEIYQRLHSENPLSLFELEPYFGRIKREFHRADNWGCSHWHSYINQRYATPTEKRRPQKTVPANESYKGVLNDEGYAVGEDCDISMVGFNFIITGKVHDKLSQTEVEELIILSGGGISKTVRDADFLVVGFNNQFKVTSKTKEADKWGVKKITPESLFNAINQSTATSQNRKAL